MMTASRPQNAPPPSKERPASLLLMHPHARPRPAFHLPVDASDHEDDDAHIAQRESARRCHALAELLSTEFGYLLDLRTLVSVYLRLLPVLKTRASSPLPHGPHTTAAYFSRPPSVHATHSHPQLNQSTCSTAPPLPNPTPARADKCTTSYLFSASDLDAVARNATQILAFHESLVRQLRQIVSPFSVSMNPREILTENGVPSYHNSHVHIRRIINAVSTVFVDHAPNFDQYQSFCSGHSEAFDIVREVQHRYPLEWDAFELHCAAVAAEMHLRDISGESFPHSESKEDVWDLFNRRHSLSSLDALPSESTKAHFLSASESSHTDRGVSSRKPRLMFMDYMIKPVQRVCRYPLLFDQLQERAGPQGFADSLLDSCPTPRESQDAVQSALWTMRTVASMVDEARRQQDLLSKSVQIVSRITQALLTSVTSHNRPPQSLSLSTFLSSLGACCLSGSLDVIHYRGTNLARLGTVRAKYLGAFLFPGGFLVLVKVTKSKAYEPKHWFSLRGFELVDSNLDDVLLPSWFRLSLKTHMFEFAASCRREKDIWVDAIRHAITEEVPWSDEPPSSLRADITALPLQDETISLLPTIQSIPELDDVTAPNSGNTAVAESALQIHLGVDDSAKYDVTAPTVAEPSRRSSIAAHPVPVLESNTFQLVRSTASAREQVDRGLLDVFSEKCLAARFHAHTHEEDLFESQRVSRTFSRSTSALTMASAMSVAAKNRLTKRESVLVPRKKSFVEGNTIVGDTESCVTSAHAVVSKPVTRTQYPSKLKIAAMTRATSSHEGDEGGNELVLESPSPMSHCSSVSFATPATPLTIPTSLPTPLAKTDGSRPHSELLTVRQRDCVPKRSKSMIENVRDFFIPRSASQTTGLTRESSRRSSVSNSSLLRWWSRESLRQRVRSAPDVPGEELPSALTTRSLHLAVPPRPLLGTTERPYSQPDLHCLYSEIVESSTAEFGGDDPFPRKGGIFSSRSLQRRCTASMLSSERREEDPTSAPWVRRNFLFLHKFTHSTRDDDDTTPTPS